MNEKVILRTRCGCQRDFRLESSQDRDFIVIALKKDVTRLKMGKVTQQTLETSQFEIGKRIFRLDHFEDKTAVYLEEME